MEYKSCFREWVDHHPMRYIIISEIVVIILFAIFASFFYRFPCVYLFVLTVVHLLFPLILRDEVSDKETFDKLFDDFLTGILIAGIAILSTGFELNLFSNHFITYAPDGDLKFIGMFFALQKLSMEFIKMYTSSKEYVIKNKGKYEDKEELVIKIQPEKPKTEETN